MGIKWYTRRFWKYPHCKIGKVYPVTHKMFYEPEDIVGYIKVLDVYRQPLGMMTAKDAYEEGGYTLDGYKRTLESITKKPWDDCAVPYVIKFQFWPSDSIDGNGGTADQDRYKRLYLDHVEEIK